MFSRLVLALLYRGLLYRVALNPNIHSILWGNSPRLGQVTYFCPSYWEKDFMAFFKINLQV